MEICAYSTLCYKLSVFSVNKGDAQPINCKEKEALGLQMQNP